MPRQEVNTSFEMLIFTRKNANCQMNLQRFYRESKKDKKSGAKKAEKQVDYCS